jgi:hypothetical protein
MASSSRPFQSQVVSRLLAGYRQLAHGTERLLRQGQTALLWGAQVIAFPLYVVFQGMRSAACTLEATQPWQPLVALLTGKPPQPMVLSADSPIQALLSITQSLAVREAGGLATVAPPSPTVGALLRQSHVNGIIVADPGVMVPLQTPVCGVASDLATRQLVLVTNNNVIFNGLTDLQRERLQQAITLLMAEYAGWCRRQWHQRQRQSPGLPLPQAKEKQWLPVRWLNQALAWMQVSPIAQVTNLFGEAQPHLPARFAPGDPFPKPYEVLAWAPSADCCSPPTGSGDLVLAGASAVTVQFAQSRAVTAYIREDGPLAKASGATSTALDPATVWAVADTAPRVDGGNVVGGSVDLKGLPGHDAIDVPVALVHYVDHPLVTVLRWLDALLHRAETWLYQAWQWLWGQA